MEDECGIVKGGEGSRNPVYEIPGGMLFGTRIDLRVRPTADFSRFLIALQSDFHGSTDPGVALELTYSVDKPEIQCRAMVGNQVIRSVVQNVRKDMFEDRFFVLSIATHPSGFKIYVDSIYLAEQRHFMDVISIQFLRIDGDLVVYCAEVNNNFSNRHLLPIQDVPGVEGKIYEIPNLKEKGSNSSSPATSLKGRKSSPSASQTSSSTPKMRADYAALISELDQQSALVDEEIREINEGARNSPMRFENRPLEIPSEDTSEGEDHEPEKAEQKKKNKKTRFESFMKKIKRKGSKKKKNGQAVMDTSESEFSTDFENYLMGTDSEVSISSRDSPTEILQQVGDEELIRLASERLERRPSSDSREMKTYSYTVAGESGDATLPLSEVFENGNSEGRGKVKVMTSDGRTLEIERTKLRISTQVVGEGEKLMSESAAECKSDPNSAVQYHVIHHHVHHHVDEPDKEWDPYHEQIPPPKYDEDYVDPNAGKPTKSRLGLLCCYGI